MFNLDVSPQNGALQRKEVALAQKLNETIYLQLSKLNVIDIKKLDFFYFAVDVYERKCPLCIVILT